MAIWSFAAPCTRFELVLAVTLPFVAKAPRTVQQFAATTVVLVLSDVPEAVEFVLFESGKPDCFTPVYDAALHIQSTELLEETTMLFAPVSGAIK